MNLIKLAKAINFYYRICKYGKMTVTPFFGVPLDPFYFNPEKESTSLADAESFPDEKFIHYSDEEDKPVLEGISSTEEKIPSIHSEIELSPIKEYASYFSVTDIPYHIIFLKSTFGLSTVNSIDAFKKALEIKSNSGIGFDKKEAQYLLKNWDKFFSNMQDRITILARVLNADDKMFPAAVDHDLAHAVIEQEITNKNFEKFLDFNFLNSSIFVKNLENNQVFSLEDLNLESTVKDRLLQIITIMFLFGNNVIPNSLGSNLLSKPLSSNQDGVNDVYIDLITMYRSQGKLTNLNLNINKLYLLLVYNESFPIENQFHYFSISDKKINFSNSENEKSFHYELTINPDALPKIKRLISNYFSTIDNILKQEMSKLKGKVIVYWS